MNSQLTLSTKRTAQGNTQLDGYFVSPPFKLMTLPNYSDEWAHGLNAMQMSSSPGLLGGDRLEIRLTLAEQTALSLNTQAFTRVQAMNEGDFAKQLTEISLAAQSRLFYLPHPLVLHKDSALKQRTTIQMGADSELIYGEIVAIGRVLNGERFAFRQFSSHLQILSENRPLVSDCIQWFPSQMPLTALSQMENFSHQGSLIYVNLAKSALEIKTLMTDLREWLAKLNTNEATQEMLLGISQLNEGGFILRVLAHRAENLQQLFESLGKKLKTQAKPLQV